MSSSSAVLPVAVPLYHLSGNGSAQGVHHHHCPPGRGKGADAARQALADFKAGAIRLPNDLPKLKKWLDRVARDGELRACYEASGAGYVLHRVLEEWGYACEVIAPSLIPKRLGVQRKHDKRDSADLARRSSDCISASTTTGTRSKAARRSTDPVPDAPRPIAK